MILVECDPDEALVMCLGLTRKEFKHKRGKFRICHVLNVELKNSIGIIEEDNPEKNQPLYLKKLKLVESKFSINVLVDTSRANKILIIKPTLEAWIIRIALAKGKRMKDYGLPDNSNDLHDVINDRLNQYRNLVIDLIQADEPSLKFLKSHLS